MKYFISSYISVQGSWCVLMEYFLIIKFPVDFLMELNFNKCYRGSAEFHAVWSPQSLTSTSCAAQGTFPEPTSAPVLECTALTCLPFSVLIVLTQWQSLDFDLSSYKAPVFHNPLASHLQSVIPIWLLTYTHIILLFSVVV